MLVGIAKKPIKTLFPHANISAKAIKRFFAVYIYFYKGGTDAITIFGWVGLLSATDSLLA